MTKNISNQTTKSSKRSKKYLLNLAKIKEVTESKSILTVQEAVELLFSLDQPKYKEGAMIEFHAKLNINPTKSDQLVRSSVVFPHGIGKKIIVAAFVPPELEAEAKKSGADFVGSDELIEEIKKTGKVPFDKAIAHPDTMKKLPSIARLLGTAGVMPNPKTGTVGENIGEMVRVIKAGKVDFKNDKTSNIHVPVGKINKEFTIQKIVENINQLIDAVEKAKPESIKKSLVLKAYLSTSASPSVRVI